MSFQYVPTQLRSPAIPGWSFQHGFWRGTGTDSGLLAFNTNNSNLGYYVITQNLWTYRLKIDNAVYSPVFNDVNGYIYWKYSSSFFYYSRSYGWILHNRFPGYEPKENYNSESKEYEGDAFHAGSVPSARDGGYSYLQPRGTNRNGGGANKTAYFDFPRWQSVTRNQFGVYEPKGGVSGRRCFREEIFRSSPLAGQQFQLLHSLSGKEERTLFLRRNSLREREMASGGAEQPVRLVGGRRTE